MVLFRRMDLVAHNEVQFVEGFEESTFRVVFFINCSWLLVYLLSHRRAHVMNPLFFFITIGEIMGRVPLAQEFFIRIFTFC